MIISWKVSWRYQHLLRMAEENHKEHCDSRGAVWDSNLLPPEYKSQAWPTTWRNFTCHVSSIRQKQ